MKIPNTKEHLVVMSHWTAGATGITNFEAKDEPLYDIAVARYGDDNLIVVRKGCPPCSEDYSLHNVGPMRDLSDFWGIFRTVQQDLAKD